MTIDRRVLQIIQEDPVQRKFFLRKVKDPKWFHSLKEIGIFSTETLPEREGVDEVGKRINVEWEPLPYLVKLARNAGETNNLILGNELVKIVRDIGLQEPGNFITRSAVLKILLALPNGLLDQSLIYILIQWITDNERMTFYGPELSDEFLKKLATDKSTQREAEQLFIALTKLSVPETTEIKKTFRATDCTFCISPYWIETGLRKNSTLVARNLGVEVYCDLKNKIEYLLLRNAQNKPVSGKFNDLSVELSYSNDQLVLSGRKDQGKQSFWNTFPSSISRKQLINQAVNDCLDKSIITEDQVDFLTDLLSELHTAVHHEQTYLSFRQEMHFDAKDPLDLLPLIYKKPTWRTSSISSSRNKTDVVGAFE